MAIKTCKENGHKYDSSEHNQCPYCPDKTEVMDTQSVPKDGSGSNDEKTEVISALSEDKTAIHKPAEDDSSTESTGSTGRKLVGWLVSFTWNSEGQDYQLREGKTLLGADNTCDIVIGDSEVSGHNTTILNRGGKFRIKDEFSTNGTLIDGHEIEDQTDLKDGSTITLGKTDFLFRKI